MLVISIYHEYLVIYRLIINDSLKSGSQIPFIQEAQKEGYGILVTNTNDNYRHDKGKIKVSLEFLILTFMVVEGV